MIGRWKTWRARRRAARLAAWVGIDDLTRRELDTVERMRRDDRTPAFAADRIQARRASRRLSSTAGGFSLEAVRGRNWRLG